MKTIVIFFSDHSPVRFTGNILECAVQIGNASYYKGFISWEDVSK